MNATKQSHPEGCSAGGIIIPQRAFTAFLFGLTKISGFQVAKTSANKRFLYYVCKLLVCDCKGTELF